MLLSKTLISVNYILQNFPCKNYNVSDELKNKVNSSVDFFEIVYLVGNYKVKGFIAQPKLITTKLMVVIYNRGGSKDFGAIDAKTLLENISSLALSNFVVIASQYSGNCGSEGKDECGGQDLESVLELKSIINELQYCDQNCINMFGVSRGAMMAYFANTRVNWINKTVIKSGEVDLLDEYSKRQRLKSFRSDMYNNDLEIENKKRSIIYNVDKILPTAKFMIFHGSLDKHVHPQRVLNFVNLLYNSNINFSFYFLSGEDHHLKNSNKFIIQKSIEWFKNYS